MRSLAAHAVIQEGDFEFFPCGVDAVLRLNGSQRVQTKLQHVNLSTRYHPHLRDDNELLSSLNRSILLPVVNSSDVLVAVASSADFEATGRRLLDVSLASKRALAS